MAALILPLVVALVCVLVAIRMVKLGRKQHARWMKVHVAKFDRRDEDFYWQLYGEYYAKHAKHLSGVRDAHPFFTADDRSLRLVEGVTL